MRKLVGNGYFLSLMGILAGFVNGLLGAGGGIIAVYALNAAFKGELSDTRDVFANALCVMLPISAVSCIGYAFMGEIRTEGLAAFMIPAIVGGLCGALLLGRIRADVLKNLFAGIVIYSGLTLMIK